MTRVSLDRAIRELADQDEVLANLVRLVGPIRHRPTNPDGHFGASVRAIVFQQLAGAAANAIHQRVRATVDGELTPEALAGVADEALRGAGLWPPRSPRCATTTKVLSGDVVLGGTARRTDEEIIEGLTTVRGIGRWTAEMYLMFDFAVSTCGRSTISASARATGWPGASANRRARRSSPCWASATAPTAPSSPATAGKPSPSAAAAPTRACAERCSHPHQRDRRRWGTMSATASPCTVRTTR